MGSETNDPLSNMTRMWMEMAAMGHAGVATYGGPHGVAGTPPQGCADLMQVWSDYCEELMCSSAFLDAQKQCMSGNLAFRKQFWANLRRLQRELQVVGREDIDALLAAIQRSRTRSSINLRKRRSGCKPWKPSSTASPRGWNAPWGPTKTRAAARPAKTAGAARKSDTN